MISRFIWDASSGSLFSEAHPRCWVTLRSVSLNSFGDSFQLTDCFCSLSPSRVAVRLSSGIFCIIGSSINEPVWTLEDEILFCPIILAIPGGPPASCWEWSSIILSSASDVYKIAFLEQILTVFRSIKLILIVFWLFDVLKWSLEFISGVFWYNLAFKTP